eukprot:3344228-Rhodomonas_salina.1
MEEQHTQKAQAYHALQLYLQRLPPDHSVELRTYVMSITGSVPEGQWGENLQAMGIDEPRSLAVHRQAVVNAIRALSEYLGVRRALAPHSFPHTTPSPPTRQGPLARKSWPFLCPIRLPYEAVAWGTACRCETVGSPSSESVY